MNKIFYKAPSTSKNISINYIAIIAQQLPTGWEGTKLVHVKTKTQLLGAEPAMRAAAPGVLHGGAEQRFPL